MATKKYGSEEGISEPDRIEIMYTKLFNSIVTSTVWQESSDIRVVWVTLLALADKNGEVQASIPGLANLANVSIPDCEEALAALSAPDEYSRTPDNEGRRIQAINGGWELLNHGTYRDKATDADRREQARLRKQRQRDRQKQDGGHANVTNSHADVTNSHDLRDDVTPVSRQNSQAEAEAEADKYKSPGVPAANKQAATPVSSSQGIYLGIAEAMGIPSEFAVALSADVDLRGGCDVKGRKINSPGAFLRECWMREQKRQESVQLAAPSSKPVPGRAREVWMVEKDLLRVKAEIKAIQEQKENRNAAAGFTEDVDQHRDRLQGQWLQYVAEAREEFATTEATQEDWARFQETLDSERETMSNNRAALDAVNSDEYQCTKLAEMFPDDVATFDRWAKETGNAWRDPKRLTEEAMNQIKSLKENIRLFENERSKLLTQQ